jgi:hypothetical protein
LAIKETSRQDFEIAKILGGFGQFFLAFFWGKSPYLGNGFL